jgi:hypothetical protein
MIYKQILFSQIKSHLQNTLLFFTDNTGGDLVERGLYLNDNEVNTGEYSVRECKRPSNQCNKVLKWSN